VWFSPAFLRAECCWAGIPPRETRQCSRWRSGRWYQERPNKCVLFFPAQARQDSVDGLLIINEGNGPTTATTALNIDFKDPLESLCPRHTRPVGAGSCGIALGRCAATACMLAIQANRIRQLAFVRRPDALKPGRSVVAIAGDSICYELAETVTPDYYRWARSPTTVFPDLPDPDQRPL
jgi:hypothetical protein